MGRTRETVRHAVAHAFDKAKKHRQSIDRISGFFMLGGVLLACTLLWFHKDNPRIVNYAVDLIPGVLAILVAFVPDLRKQHMAWRIAIVIVGVAWSILLWRKQALDDAAQQHAQSRLLESAQKHIDEQVGKITEDLHNQSSASHDQMAEVSRNLKTTADVVGGLRAQMDRTEINLSKGIDKVKSPPLELAKLAFSFVTTDTKDFPLLTRQIAIGPTGSFVVEITAKNTSGVPAEGIELWMNICPVCVYAKEPVGFQKLSDEHVRYSAVRYLNPAVYIEPMRIEINVPNDTPLVEIDFKYSCRNCGKVDSWQKLTATPVR